MVLFDSPIIRLNYTPATDILVADLSNKHEFYALEVRETLKTIVEHVRHYDVRRLLMDSRKRVLVIDPLEYVSLMSEFTRALQTTRLQKLARIYTGISSREDLVQAINLQMSPTYTLRTFPSHDQALAWLAAES
ncbi:hypothetical protein GCM10023188_06440 [Pontibacter saemangeumensis]|uniref:SpoIIAA-like n=1 Tax=Pontibacter saemangeumensis TaxID=1084525 RepID=A0ABP8L9J7_9BACT